MNYYKLSKDIRSHFIFIGKSNDNPKLRYHNIQHTLDVADRAMEISTYYDVYGEELFIIFVSALFHDISFFFTGSENHEVHAVAYMHEYCSTLNIPEGTRSKIASAILATQRINRPSCLIEKIVCDADTYHFGTPLFRIGEPLLNEECRLLTGFSELAWPGKSIERLKGHYFYTEYCQDKLSRGKVENIKWLNSLMQKSE